MGSKPYHYAVVEAPYPSRAACTSTWSTYKVFELLHMQWMGIWNHRQPVTTTARKAVVEAPYGTIGNPLPLPLLTKCVGEQLTNKEAVTNEVAVTNKEALTNTKAHQAPTKDRWVRFAVEISAARPTKLVPCRHPSPLSSRRVLPHPRCIMSTPMIAVHAGAPVWRWGE